MMNQGAATCARQFSFATLSAWRDGQLPAKLAAEISDHTPHCAVCQTTLAEMGLIAQALRRHDPPTLLTPTTQGQLWRSLQPTAIQRQGVSPVSLSRRTVWRGLSGAIAAALIILIFVQVFRLNTPVRKTTSVAASPLASPSRVWGTSAVDTIPLAPLGLVAFSATDLSPDGSFIVGLAIKSANTAELGTIDTHTQQYHKLASLPAGGQGVTPVTDGRYIAYQNFKETATDPKWQNIILLDTTTQQQITLGGQGGTSADLLALDHGTLYWQTLTEVILQQQTNGGVVTSSTYEAPGPLLATDLATQTTRTLLAAKEQVNSVILPIVLYQHIDRNGQNVTIGDLHALNLSTGRDDIVPTVPYGLGTSSDNGLLYGNSEIISQGHYYLTAYTKNPADATWQKIATLPIASDSIGVFLTNSGEQQLIANDRLILWGDILYNTDGKTHLLAWDRAKQTEVDLGLTADTSQSPNFLVNPFARGQWIMYETQVNGTNVLNVIDTTRLPGA